MDPEEVRILGPERSAATGTPLVLNARLARSLQRDFEEFGLNGYEARVLVALVGAGTANATELARLSGLGRTSVYPVLQELTARGLADEVPGKTAQWASPGAEEALERLLDQQEERLQELRDLNASARQALASFARQSERHLPYVNFLRGAAQVKRAYDRLLAAVEEELLIFNVPPYSSTVGRPVPAVLAALKRGVHAKVLFQDAELHDADTKAFHTENEVYFTAGTEGRVVDELPAKLVVADRRMALLALPDPVDTEGFPATLHIEHRGFASMQAHSFDTLWESARPYPSELERSRRHQ